MFESGPIVSYIQGVLAADSQIATLLALRESESEIPAQELQTTQRFPALTFSWQGNADTSSLESVRATGSKVLLIQATDKAITYDTVQAIMDRVDTLVQGMIVDSILGIGGMSVTREGEVRFPESRGTVNYRHLGGLYRVNYGVVH